VAAVECVSSAPSGMFSSFRAVRRCRSVYGSLNRRTRRPLIETQIPVGTALRSLSASKSSPAAHRAPVAASAPSAEERPKRDIMGGSRAYVELAKPELSALVIATGTWGFLLTGSDDTVAAVSTIGGLVFAASSAAAWNQTVEAKFDAKMIRTATRPIPSGRLNERQAAAFCAATGVSGVSLLTLGANSMAGGLGLANILLYGMVYTPMKRITPYNTHVGAVVGALPVVVGWVGGGGPLFAVEPAMLFSIMYAWQFPHFMGIAWKYRKDYANAGYQMVTRDDPGAVRTAYWAEKATYVLVAIPFVSTYVGMTSSMFIISGAIPNAVLLRQCLVFKKKPTSKNAGKIILVGFVYLMAFLGLMFFHSTSEALDRHLDSIRNIARRVGRQLCVHETKMTRVTVPEMCPVPQVFILSPSKEIGSYFVRRLTSSKRLRKLLLKQRKGMTRAQAHRDRSGCATQRACRGYCSLY